MPRGLIHILALCLHRLQIKQTKLQRRFGVQSSLLKENLYWAAALSQVPPTTTLHFLKWRSGWRVLFGRAKIGGSRDANKCSESDIQSQLALLWALQAV